MQTPYEQSGEVRPPAEPPRPGRRFVLFGVAMLGAGLAIGALLAGLGVAGARTATPAAPTPPAGEREHGPLFGHHRWNGPGWMGRGPFAHGGFAHGRFGDHGFGMGGLHGQITVPAPGGGSRTVSFQRGSVTSVSASSIGVKSEDGYTASYPLDERTLVVAGLRGIGDVKPGDMVGILAVGTGSNARAVRVLDVTALQRVRGGPFPGWGAGDAPDMTSG